MKAERMELKLSDEGLKQYLQFERPAPNRDELTLAVSRSREVTLSWTAIIRTPDAPQGATVPFEPSELGSEPLRMFLAQQWGFADFENPTNAEIDKVRSSFVVAAASTPQIWQVKSSSLTTAQQYQIIAKSPFTFGGDFDNAANFSKLWEKVDRVQLVAVNKPEMEVMDLSAGIIWRTYRGLNSLRTAAKLLHDKADKLLEAAVTGFLDADQLGQLIDRYRTMKGMYSDIEERLFRLRDQAQDLGYVLNVGTEIIKLPLPNNTTVDVHPGELYSPTVERLSWQTTHVRKEISYVRIFGIKFPRVRHVNYTVQQTATVVVNKKVTVDFDPWVERERLYASQGLKSYRFERAGDRYVTSDGVALDEVLLLCDRDAQFWEKCVVWLPVYEQQVIEGEVLTKYVIIRRPIRGSEVIHLPRIFIEDRIAVRRRSGVRVEVGDLAHTINLAPGEKRTITVERTTTRDREDSRTAKSLVDLVDTSSTDFSTEFEKEARHEKEKTNSTNWSVKASGSYGAASGSASASGSSTTTTKDFARQLEKVAQKASRTVTKKTSEEITTVTTVKTQVNTSDKNVIEIENINAGRSLNLAFYRLNNISTISMFLDQLELVVLPGVEVISGSGIVLPETFALRDLPSALRRLSLTAMPVSPIGDPELARRRYSRQLLLDLIFALEDYDPAVTRGAEGQRLLTSAGPSLEEIRKEVTNYKPEGDPEAVNLATLVDKLQTYLAGAITGTTPILPSQELVTGSAGFYLDSFVGVRPATEDYAERAREAELSIKGFEAAEASARAAYYRSLVKPTGDVPGRALDALKTLELSFAEVPPAGNYKLWVDGTLTDKTFKAKAGEKIYKITWTEVQPWLSGAARNSCNLVHETLPVMFTVVI